jgi:two-component system, LytTR family, response regulator
MTGSHQRQWRVLVVDDEPHARRTIRTLLGRFDRVDVVGECDHAEAAVASIRELRPDLLFIDVQMPGATGLDAVHEAGLGSVPVVIFTTAYSEYALKAFEAQAYDYLLKPFSDERFQRVMERVISQLERSKPAVVDRGERTVTVRDAGKTLVIPIKDIDWIEAEDYCSRIHAGDRKPLVRRTMQSFIDELDDQFMRTHRSSIVNLVRIRELRPLSSGEAEAILVDGTRVRVSRAHRSELESRLQRRSNYSP